MTPSQPGVSRRQWSVAQDGDVLVLTSGAGAPRIWCKQLRSSDMAESLENPNPRRADVPQPWTAWYPAASHCSPSVAQRLSRARRAADLDPSPEFLVARTAVSSHMLRRPRDARPRIPQGVRRSTRLGGSREVARNVAQVRRVRVTRPGN